MIVRRNDSPRKGEIAVNKRVAFRESARSSRLKDKS
jgi:hypothetical protein